MSQSSSLDRILGYVVIAVALYLVLKMMWNSSPEKYADVAPANQESDKQVAKTKIELVTQPSYALGTLLGKQPEQSCAYGDCDQTPHPEFLNEFANFRSMTNQSSDNMYPGMVDMVTEMYLGDNTTAARNYDGKQIKDVFADLTKGIEHEDLKCIRIPTLESPLFSSDDSGIVGYDDMQAYHTVI